jgi:acetolactate synthase I/III small subunit
MQPTELTPQQVFRKRAAGEAVHPGEAACDHRCVLAVRLENHIGALNRVANLFSARGFNLESVTVSPTDDPTVSRMTITTSGPTRMIEQVIAQVSGLVDVLSVEDLTEEEHVEREVSYAPNTRAELMDLIAIYRGAVVDVTPDSMMIELTGPVTKVNSFVAQMRRFGITDVARSGRVAMRRALIYGS